MRPKVMGTVMTDKADELLDALARAWAEATMPPIPNGAVPEEGWRADYEAGCREEVAAMLEIQRAILAERPWLARDLLPKGWTVTREADPIG